MDSATNLPPLQPALQFDPAVLLRAQDVRVAAEANGIGWTVWEYTDIFGLTRESARPGQAGRRTLDPEAFEALGLGPR